MTGEGKEEYFSILRILKEKEGKERKA